MSERSITVLMSHRHILLDPKLSLLIGSKKYSLCINFFNVKWSSQDKVGQESEWGKSVGLQWDSYCIKLHQRLKIMEIPYFIHLPHEGKQLKIKE
jgi:hypothetical protein